MSAGNGAIVLIKYSLSLFLSLSLSLCPDLFCGDAKAQLKERSHRHGPGIGSGGSHNPSPAGPGNGSAGPLTPNKRPTTVQQTLSMGHRIHVVSYDPTSGVDTIDVKIYTAKLSVNEYPYSYHLQTPFDKVSVEDA